MEISNLIPHIEALIFASDKPLTGTEITELVNQAFGFMEDKLAVEQIDAALEGIVEKYNSEFYPFEVRQSGGGWQFLTKKDFHKTVAQLNGEKFLKRLSAAALETLAIIAYKQPVTKGEIESIRGVSSDYAVQKLLEKELIIISGRNEKMPGHPLVYATSKNFMDYFGINSADDLPKIREVLTDQLVEPTVVNSADFEQSNTLLVTDSGELVDVSGEPDAVSTADADAPEGHLNGHAFEEMGAEPDEPVLEEESGEPGGEDGAEDPATEEAMEEYITDEIFIEGDEEEEIEELLEEEDGFPEEESGETLDEEETDQGGEDTDPTAERRED
jgi:segregation and condensation protein B